MYFRSFILKLIVGLVGLLCICNCFLFIALVFFFHFLTFTLLLPIFFPVLAYQLPFFRDFIGCHVICSTYLQLIYIYYNTRWLPSGKGINAHSHFFPPYHCCHSFHFSVSYSYHICYCIIVWNKLLSFSYKSKRTLKFI